MTGAQFLASVSLYGCSRELIRSDHVIREPSGCRHEFVAAIYQIRGAPNPSIWSAASATGAIVKPSRALR
jgi:hypothetical protein